MTYNDEQLARLYALTYAAVSTRAVSELADREARTACENFKKYVDEQNAAGSGGMA